MRWLSWLLGMLRGPGPAIADAVATGGRTLGLKAALLMGVLWAAFVGALAIGGHQPSGPLVLPIPRESYYAVEAAFIIPTYVALFYAFSGVIHGLARKFGSEASWTASQGVGGLSLALPSILAWWLPDVVVYAWAGFSALAKAMPYYVPLSIVGTWVLGTAGVRAVHRLGPGRALLTVGIAWGIQAAIAAPLLR